MKALNRCWAIVDLDILETNVRELKKLTPAGCRFMAVVKAEGYGLGMLPVAEACMAGGADWFGVATVKEAIELRNGGVGLPILVLGVTPSDWAEELAGYRLAQAVPSLGYAKELSQKLEGVREPVSVHIKVDSGMGRLGWYTAPETMDGIVRELSELGKLPGLRVEGIMTHLSSSRDPSEAAVSFTRTQLETFTALCKKLEEAEIRIPVRHVLNTGGLINYPEYAMEMVRVGHFLYENIRRIDAREPGPAVECAIEIKASIAYLKEIPAGSAVGYDRTYHTARMTRIAVLGLGYCDGYNAFLSNTGQVLLRGQKAPVIGRVCMDQMIIDVTDVEGAAVGDVVTIVGRDGDLRLTMNDVLQQVRGVMNGPISSCIMNRMERYYRKNGEIVAYADAHLSYVPCSGVRLL